MMYKSTKQLKAYLGTTAGPKAAYRWRKKRRKDELVGTPVTWEAYKEFWTEEIHTWQRNHDDEVAQANQAEVVQEQVHELTEQINSMRYAMQALQLEDRSRNSQDDLALLRTQQVMQQAMQAEQLRRQADDASATSAMTEYFAGLQASAGLQANAAATITNTTASSNQYTGPIDQTVKQQQLLQTAKGRSPAAYKHINEGKGKQFKRYCWKCGCNCTHSNRGCYELTALQRQACKSATFTDTMGGSTKILERRDKYQKDYRFDSL